MVTFVVTIVTPSVRSKNGSLFFSWIHVPYVCQVSSLQFELALSFSI